MFTSPPTSRFSSILSRLNPKTATLAAIIVIPVVLVITAIIYSLLFPQSAPKPTPTSTRLPPPPQITLPSTSHTSLSNVEFSAPPITLPSNLSVYQASSQQNPSIIAKMLATKLNLRQSPVSNRLWLDQTQKISLHYSDHPPLISYDDSTFHDTTSPQPLQLNQAIAAAVDFIDTLNIPVSYKLNQELVGFADMGWEPEAVAPDQAFIITLPFYQTINNTPVNIDANWLHPLSVWIGPQYQIIRFNITPPLHPITEVSVHQSLSLAEIKQQIANNQGIIISIYQTPTSQSDISRFDHVDITKLELEYRYSSANQLIYPYIKAYGTAQIADLSIGIELLLPAIPTQ